MRASIIHVVAFVSILAGLCLSQIFTSFHPNSLRSIEPLKPASSLIGRQLSTAFNSRDSLAAAAVAAHPAPSNPLVTLQDEIKALESKDGTLQRAMTRASEALKVTQEKVSNPAARSSFASAKVSASSYSPSQIAADLANTKVSSKAAASAVADAQKHLKKLASEEYDLKQEIHDLLSKLENVQIITSAHVYVADGMGGSVIEAEISRPIGGKSSVKIIRSVDAAVSSAEKEAASAEAAKHAGPSFPEKEKASDGMGGANVASSVEKASKTQPAVGPLKGMTPVISGDDGMGERIVPAAKQPLNAESSSNGPGSLSSAKPDAGVGEKVGKVSGLVIPTNVDAKPAIFSHGQSFDGMGGKVQGIKHAGSATEVPLTGPMISTNPNNDGMGGKKGTIK
jgi:hypothetical protein